jgi:hypothetical protein
VTVSNDHSLARLGAAERINALEAEVMHGIAGQLTIGGLEVTRQVTSDGLTGLTVTNPACPQAGSVLVGYHGYIILERWATGHADTAVGEIIHAVNALLASAGPPDVGGKWGVMSEGRP